mmetsp:Transcript_11146/g.34177  ORF Transcript_11146/g.34177 Transcript_11146/m.34177 type:complete len:223 (-) Transcript_11146:3564-4232(-)
MDTAAWAAAGNARAPPNRPPPQRGSRSAVTPTRRPRPRRRWKRRSATTRKTTSSPTCMETAAAVVRPAGEVGRHACAIASSWLTPSGRWVRYAAWRWPRRRRRSDAELCARSGMSRVRVDHRFRRCRAPAIRAWSCWRAVARAKTVTSPRSARSCVRPHSCSRRCPAAWVSGVCAPRSPSITPTWCCRCALARWCWRPARSFRRSAIRWSCAWTDPPCSSPW